ncbi:protein STRUBBELIG-RECEPTOR FAMILY 8-like isoform X1 [Panicum miliaceum]|uniref:Protein STRUBBELIG-RECEPTOR FAMILY 8-like isoform X1 n=1 Tax=Panicum miliaceum TaxID=4540 RepID=A0A3L6RRX2_PANMI|nr:protein STRUBBELIG-RECEPTOR FAMILY 8-like isoform X1 [Panicum miliaceum]
MEALAAALAAGLLLALAVAPAGADTDSADAAALGNLYTSWNSPSQLAGWSAGGGDPCGAAWQGVTCSGAGVTEIKLPGIGLDGSLGYELSNLFSLKTLDLSNNNLHGSIPYQLPPNLTYLNLASNSFSGTLPYSIINMASIEYLNLSHNSLSNQMGDLFGNLSSLSELDVSFNKLTGDLPNSIGSLSNLSSLYMQNNQFAGSVNVLRGLSPGLTTLNIANNNFSGWIPKEFSSIPDLTLEGNSFANGPAPPPPPFMPPPPQRSRNRPKHPQGQGDAPKGSESPTIQSDKKQGLGTGLLVGIIAGSIVAALCVLLLLVCCMRNVRKRKDDASSETKGLGTASSREIPEQSLEDSSIAAVKLPHPEKMTPERVYGKNGSMRKTKVPITATPYTVASLQVATNSFCQDSLLGEGSLGRVYKADFSNGKVLAVKKIDSAALSLQEEDNFLEAVSSMSRLRHPNIVPLTGYCVEHGQRLLVYEYIGNGTLHDMLHFSDEMSRRLTWNIRVRIALGTARALEYLHEVCLPSVVHRNFKSSNILLDEEHNPHLSDCGLAALTPNTERQVSTEVCGSFGYSAPEFAMSGNYTVKSDVYSFGVVMLELLTGRKPLDSSRERSEQSLVRWATPQLHDIDALAKMVDPALNGMYPAKSLSRFADIIALCVQPEPEFRPPMSEVVQQLVRLMQRASIVRRQSGEELGFSYRALEREGDLRDISF